MKPDGRDRVGRGVRYWYSGCSWLVRSDSTEGRRDRRPMRRPFTRIDGEAGGVRGGVGGPVPWGRGGVVLMSSERRGKRGKWRRARFGRRIIHLRLCRGW